MKDSQAVKADILLVDDTPENLRLLGAALSKKGYKVRSVINGSMALMGAQAAPPDLILLDICMPGMNGYEVCEKLKANGKTADIPIIFISALDEVLDKVKAFGAGGVDYVTKPFQFEEVIARIENQLTIRRLQASLEALNGALEARVKERTLELEAEILERKKAQEKLLYLAMHDPLTHLPNRTLLMEELVKALEDCREREDYGFAVMFLDCDRFKRVNDSLGHTIGDKLLIEVANRLQSCLRSEDMLSRLGGDEFAILFTSVQDANWVLDIAAQLNHKLLTPFQIDEYEVYINASIGIVFNCDRLYQQLPFPIQGKIAYDNPDHLLRDADTAMYRAKEAGKGHYQIFNPQMHNQALKMLHLENSLRRALERDEFILYYQPIVSLKRGKIIGFEALLRWYHPQRGFISPSEFIPAAEETGFIVPIGEWVLKSACQQVKQWHDQEIGEHPLTISVNLSVRQFGQPDLIPNIDQILQTTQLDSRSLKLEITESVIIEHPEAVMAIFDELKSRWIKLSLDDFGTGYSSLSYLHRFPMDTLKIDRSFVQQIDEGGKNLEIVQAIVSLGHNLGMEVIAEGIETPQQLAHLRDLGCDYGQGYLFSKPVDAKASETLLKRDLRW
ncbi:EAL domain-containing protein [Spirulina sp. CS-785/01]|nr:EAL domain-containing protein [Spirulina sp. CS-785/01]